MVKLIGEKWFHIFLCILFKRYWFFTVFSKEVKNREDIELRQGIPQAIPRKGTAVVDEEDSLLGEAVEVRLAAREHVLEHGGNSRQKDEPPRCRPARHVNG
jgi:hypothetical protein